VGATGAAGVDVVGVVVVVGGETAGGVLPGLTGWVVAVGLAGAVGAICEATGFLASADKLTGRRCCPLGPAAEATAPMLIVAARAAEVAARRARLLRVRVGSASRTSRIFFIIPLSSKKGAAGKIATC
jgi:hypothetical protein